MKGDGQLGRHRGACHRAVGRIHAGRDVQRHHRPPSGVDRLDQRRRRRPRCAPESRAEQRIDHDIGTAQRASQLRLRRPSVHGHAQPLGDLQIAPRFGAESRRRPRQQHLGLQPSGQQVTRHDEAVAAVVSCPGDSREPPAIGKAAHDLVRGAHPGPLHQHRGRDAEVDRGRIKRPHLGRVVERQQLVHGSDHRNGYAVSRPRRSAGRRPRCDRHRRCGSEPGAGGPRGRRSSASAARRSR